MAQRQIHTEIDIAAPIAEVWRVLTDWPNYGTWNPWMTGVSGTLRVGARLEATLSLGARALTIRPTIVHVDEGRSFRWLGHMMFAGVFDGEHAFALEPLDEGQTRFTHSERFGGVLAGLTLALVGTQTEQGFKTMNEALKRRCETPKGSSPSTV